MTEVTCWKWECAPIEIDVNYCLIQYSYRLKRIFWLITEVKNKLRVNKMSKDNDVEPVARALGMPHATYFAGTRKICRCHFSSKFDLFVLVVMLCNS